MRSGTRGRNPAAALLLVVLLGLGSGGIAAQQQSPDDIAESQRRLEQIRREREQLREEMTRIRSRVSDLSSEVSNINRQVGNSANLVRELELQVENRAEQIESNTYELLLTRTLLIERRSILHRRLREIYKRGPLQTLQVLLTAESFSGLINRYKYLYQVARYDRLLAEEVTTLERQLTARERALRVNMTQLEGVREERSQEYRLLASLQSQQRQALTNVRSRERTTAQRISQLERDESRLANVLATLEAQRRTAEIAATTRSAGVPGPGSAITAPTLNAARMGTLSWPVEGPLLYRYGRVAQPNGTAVRWNGIGIGARAGTAVRSVEAGSVALAGPFEGYGPTVILSHGGGYYTLYLYLQRLSVAVGDQVASGQTLGTVGGETSSEGPHLEFQIRTPGGQAVDPMTWLRSR